MKTEKETQEDVAKFGLLDSISSVLASTELRQHALRKLSEDLRMGRVDIRVAFDRFDSILERI